MTRRKARELAMRLIYAQAATNDQPEDVLDTFFAEEHYASLQGEDELFDDAPDEAQLLYIRTLVITCALHREEEISKSYDLPETTGFINGVLGTFMRGEGSDESL